MKGLPKYLFICIMVIVCSACIFPYEPDVTRYKDVLIIDGLLTDEPGSSVIRLSRSASINFTNLSHHGEQERSDSGATVFVTDDLENVSMFHETSPCVFHSDDSTFQGITGRSYQLFVITKDDQKYESDFITLKSVPEIDTLYAEWGEFYGEKEIENGFYIYVDSYDPDNSTRFYRYEFEETWEFTVPYPSRLKLENDILVSRDENVGRCWKTVYSSDINIVSNEKLESNVILKLPVHFVSLETNRLSRRYSILVRQYSMSREAFAFWDQLKKSNQDVGTLFDGQPTQPRGNIYNRDAPESPVFGFFEATSVSEKRIFLRRSDVPDQYQSRVKSGFEECRDKYFIVDQNYFDPTGYSNYCLVSYTASDFLNKGIGMTWEFQCCDCTRSGSNIMPDFW